VVIAQNEMLERKPELLNHDPFGEGWMLIVRPASDDWSGDLVTGDEIAPTFEAWFAAGDYKERTN
jgi:glycine cleavage system H protein